MKDSPWQDPPQWYDIKIIGEKDRSIIIHANEVQKLENSDEKWFYIPPYVIEPGQTTIAHRILIQNIFSITPNDFIDWVYKTQPTSNPPVIVNTNTLKT